MTLEQRLSALELSPLAAWVYDHGTYRFCWANHKALEFWSATDRAELFSRDLSDISASTRLRLDNYFGPLERGESFEDDWTLYPRGEPKTVTLHASGVRLDDGRLAILFHAVFQAAGFNASMVRVVEAMRHASIVINLAGVTGQFLFHNPAALRIFGDLKTLQEMFVDPLVATALGDLAGRGGTYTGEVRVRTVQGERWHAVEARDTTDPATGVRVVLIQQTDITKRRQAEDRVEEQGQLIDQLNRSLALVEEQRKEILSLSAPIIDVGKSTLALPLIGRLDAGRSSEIGERLLGAIVEASASHVILDLTGMDRFDEEGTEGLFRIVRAVRLLGSKPIITGIRPELARILASAGIHLGGLPTLRSLRDAIEQFVYGRPS